jgi:iron(III) transport system substrate-binding protein
VRRIVDEHKAGVHYFDIHVGGTSSMTTGLVKPGLVEPLSPYMILPEVKDAKNWWGGHIYVDKQKSVAYTFQAYMTQTVWHNTDLVKPGEMPSYDNLLDPKWKGRIGILDPRKPGSGGSTWSFLWQTKGREYLDRLVSQNLKSITNQRVLAEALARGKLAMTIGVSFYTYRPFIEAGQPVKPLPFFKEGTYISGGSGSLSVIKNQPHPNAAKVFVNWLLSKEGQEVFSKALGQATRRLDVDTSWINSRGDVRAAKDFLPPEDYSKYENQSQEKIETIRLPARKLARQLLR